MQNDQNEKYQIADFLQSSPKDLNDPFSQLSPRSQNEEDNNYLLIKNLPKNITYDQIKATIPDVNSAIDVLIVSHSNNVYVKFANRQEIKNILIKHTTQPFRKDGKKLDLCFVTKMPLDLNKTSKIVLVTLYNEKLDINVQTIYSIFGEFGKILKIIIFKRKNYQVLVEFEYSDDAQRFKSSLHDVNYKGLFFLKIQFTSKKELVVNNNNLYEFDFTNVEDPANVFKNFPVNIAQKTNDKIRKSNFEDCPQDYDSHHQINDGYENDRLDLDDFSTKENTSKNKKSQVEHRFDPRSQIPMDPSERNAQLSREEELKWFSFQDSRKFSEKDETGISRKKFFSEIQNYENSQTGFMNYLLRYTSIEEFNQTYQREFLIFDKSFNLIIDGLPTGCRSKNLLNLFSLYGSIRGVSVLSVKGIAIVGFTQEKEGLNAAIHLNSQSLFGKSLIIEVLKKNPFKIYIEDFYENPSD